MPEPKRSQKYDFRVFARAASLGPVNPIGVAVGQPPAGEEPPSGIFARQVTADMVPRLAVSQQDLLKQPLDHRSGFVVSFIDGSYNVEAIVDMCAMRRAEVIQILRDLAIMGVVEFDE